MKKLLALILVLLIPLFIAQAYWKAELKPLSNDTTTKKILIEKGKSVTDIAAILKEENLIKSEFIFKVFVRQSGRVLSAGTFELSPSMSVDEITKVLSGQPNEAWVTLIEGWRKEEMAEELEAELKIDKGAFLKLSKEGYMFPDTYLFPRDVTAEQVVKALKTNFDQKYTGELRAKIRAKGLSEDEGVILASIVEREGRSQKVRTEIAGILLKRLNIDMGLNVDASLQYALGYQQQEKSWWKRHLSSEDKKIESPFNTYRYRGLPPTPICNPSVSSLQAVADANPKTPYLYYYHDSKGNSHYATTLEEHNENVANNP
jgi:UPF0755 protein